MTSRLFIALELPETVIDKLILIRDKIYPPDNSIKWEGKGKLHITLKFLGDTDNSKIPEINNILSGIINCRNRFEMEFNSFGMFYFKRNPKILYAGFDYSEHLVKLHSEIEEEISLQGFERDNRKFKSHVTLLRVKGKEDRFKLERFLNYKIKIPKFQVSTITLFKSTLRHSGSIYEKLKCFNLK